MAIGWLSVLQMVPWSDVIKNAPKVADSAKKLWNATAKKSPVSAPVSDSAAALPRTPEALAIAALQERVQALQAAASELQEQMLASSELIKTLAEQNAQLVQRIETQRVRLVLLAALCVLGVLAVTPLIWLR